MVLLVRVGPYELGAEIGRGGMAVVYRARSADGRDLALKLIDRVRSARLDARFAREGRLLASFTQEEGFVPLLDTGETPQVRWIAMPFVPGGTLRARLDRGPLAVEEALALARSLAAAAGRAHARGIVHRDLKPENVLFTADGRPLIADLGLAKHFLGSSTGAPSPLPSADLSKTGELRGTAEYMAPEQFRDAKRVGPSADVFSLGCMLHECLVGEPPYRRETLMAIVSAMEAGSRERVRKLRPEVPRWLEAAVDRALDQDPARRFADGAAFAAALAPRAKDEGPSRRFALALVGLALLAVVATLFLLRGTLAPTGADPAVSPAASSSMPSATASPRPPGATPSPSPLDLVAQPAWLRALPESERPPVPLPAGLEATATPGEYRWARDGSVLVFVPGGKFVMGAGAALDDPRHEVELSPYFLGKLELTNAQFEKFANETHHQTSAERSGLGYIPGGRTKKGATWRTPNGEGKGSIANHPVVQVSWLDAQAYVAWAGLRLPTEAEWERAASWDPKAKRSRSYAWGDAEPGADGLKRANLCDKQARKKYKLWVFIAFDDYDDGFADTAPVGSFPDGVSPVGALDMTGNAGEWCADGYDLGFYKSGPAKDPLRDVEGCQDRVFRGGGCWSIPNMASTTVRLRLRPDEMFGDLGLRVALGARPRR